MTDKNEAPKSSKWILTGLTLIAILALVFGVGYIYNSYTQSNPSSIPTNTSNTSSPSVPPVQKEAPKDMVKSNLNPNPELTPGDVYANITSEDVCESGYSGRVRNVPASEKKKVYVEYGIPYPQPEGAYEVDHFISLELGGSNDIKNLWPEPTNPTPGFHQKDKVENYLHKQVCDGKMSLGEAQDKIRKDWYAVYLNI
jgi:hypothetical protein